MSGETKPFRERLSEGHEFEDFCVDVLWDNGIPLLLYRSRQRQWKSGESRIGAEVKLDRKWQSTGNLFIECEERRNSDGSSQWRPAGIYEDTKPWLYVIGSEAMIWIHGVTILRLLHETGRYEWKQTDTAKGFTLPLADSDKYALKIIKPTIDQPMEPTPATATQEPYSGKPTAPTPEELKDRDYYISPHIYTPLNQPVPSGRNEPTDLF